MAKTSAIQKNLKRIGVLGLSYKGDLKVSVLSKVIPLVKSLKKKKLKVKTFLIHILPKMKLKKLLM